MRLEWRRRQQLQNQIVSNSIVENPIPHSNDGRAVIERPDNQSKPGSPVVFWRAVQEIVVDEWQSRDWKLRVFGFDKPGAGLTTGGRHNIQSPVKLSDAAEPVVLRAHEVVPQSQVEGHSR